MLNGPFHVDLY